MDTLTNCRILSRGATRGATRGARGRAFGNISFIFALVVAMLALTGCVSSMKTAISASKHVANDTIALYKKLDLDDEVLADALAIERIVTRLDAEDRLLTSKGISWTNDVTGNQGKISYFSDNLSPDQTCRNFRSSLSNYQGIALYEGVSCKFTNGEWILKSFNDIS